jgi:hypothetical protein
MDEVLEAARRRLMCFSSGLFAPSGRKWRPECWSCGGFRYSVRSRGERHARLSRAGLGLVKRVPTGCQEKNRKGEPGEEGGRIRWESKGKDKMGKRSRRAYKKGMGPGKRNGHDLFFFPAFPLHPGPWCWLRVLRNGTWPQCTLPLGWLRFDPWRQGGCRLPKARTANCLLFWQCSRPGHFPFRARRTGSADLPGQGYGCLSHKGLWYAVPGYPYRRVLQLQHLSFVTTR